MESKRALMQLSLRWLRWGHLFCWQISRETNLWWTRLWGTSSTLTVWGLFMEASRFCCDNKLLRSHHSTAPSKNTLDKVSDVTATVVVSVTLNILTMYVREHPFSHSTLANQTESVNLLRGFFWSRITAETRPTASSRLSCLSDWLTTRNVWTVWTRGP